MALFGLSNIAIKGISASVPKQTEDNFDSPLIADKQKDIFINTTGIRFRRIAASGTSASDLCYDAAIQLLHSLQWRPEEIDILIFVTQTPDYIIPNSASILQLRLGLSTKCVAFDINLGCSGYVYGLSVIGSLLQNIPNGKGLLLVGDCSSSVISASDKSTKPLFSDAGSATAIERVQGSEWYFNLQTDGRGYRDIMVEGGGMRVPFNRESLVQKEISSGEIRGQLHMKLDGVNIFNFALREVASNIQSLFLKFNLSQSSVDYFVLHQANRLILESIRAKLKESVEKFPYSLYRFGYTSSASSPITIVTELREGLIEKPSNLLLSGFGVGLSWGSLYLPFTNVVIPGLVEI